MFDGRRQIGVELSFDSHQTGGQALIAADRLGVLQRFDGPGRVGSSKLVLPFAAQKFERIVDGLREGSFWL